MRIIQKGTFDANGMPTGWYFDCSGGAGIDISDDRLKFGACLELKQDGRVLVNGVEIVEWTQERQKAMSA